MKAAYLFVLLLAGCASRDGYWDKPDATDQGFNMDRGACIAQMYSVPFANAYQQAAVFAGCMQGRGWYWTRK